MRLTQLVTDPFCQGKICPTVYATDRGTVVIQGDRVTEPTDVEVPEHEVLVEIPRSLVEELVRSGALES
ncbi:MAG TPA: hypothetical protein VK988_18550 [Acidimicrobiales bacterium]|nr:hypothetical protein [Acidimicrobiales bacterium]